MTSPSSLSPSIILSYLCGTSPHQASQSTLQNVADMKHEAAQFLFPVHYFA